MGGEEEWRCIEWPDGSLYEGLSKDNRCERQGIIHFSNSDRYEGEFVNNRMQGYGVYIWKDGTIYRGEWQQGMMHGCGVRLNKGSDGAYKALEGKFFADDFIGPIMSCSTESAGQAAVEADVAAALSRALRTKVGTARLRKSRGGALTNGISLSRDPSTNHSDSISSSGTPLREEPSTSMKQPYRDNMIGFGGFRLPEFRWPWQQEAPSQRGGSDKSIAAPTALELDSFPMRVSDGEIRSNVRPLNEREQAQVGGLVHRLMVQGRERGGSVK